MPISAVEPTENLEFASFYALLSITCESWTTPLGACMKGVFEGWHLLTTRPERITIDSAVMQGYVMFSNGGHVKTHCSTGGCHHEIRQAS